MQELKESDLVYTKYGYGKVIKPPTPRSIEPIEPTESSGSTLPVEPAVQNDPRDSNKTILDNSSSSVELNPNPLGNKQTEKLRSDTITEVKLSWGGSIYLEASELKKKISLKVKTFYGHRKTIKLDVDINISIQQLKNILLESHLENAKILYNLRLIYPMGQMQELKATGNTIEQYRIPDNSNLVLLAQMTFSWDATMRGTGIKLSNSNLTATKVPGADYQTILGNLLLSSGSHYWEIKVDRYSDEEDLFIGVARKEIDLYSKPMDNGMFWGYMCLCAKKVGPDGVFTDYGYQAKKGDTIGVLLEFKSGIASLSFYRNETRCGVAFSNLSGSFYPALCMYYGDIQVTLDPKAPVPIS